MQNIPNIDVDNLKESLDAYTLIDLLKAGYKQSIKENDDYRKLRNRTGGMPDFTFAKIQTLNNSFNDTIVLLENLEKQLDKLDKLHDQAQEMAGF